MTPSRATTASAALLAAALVGALTPAAQASAPAGTPASAPAASPAVPKAERPLAPTPYMGWNTYFGLGAPTEKEVKSVADHLLSSGLAKSGYDIVWLDGGWQADEPRNSAGELVAHPGRFPSGIPSLVSYLHARGLKAGIYTDAGTYDGGETCGLGSRGHYQQDAQRFADWKFDAIKVDFLCGITEKADPEPAFREFGAAVAATGRPMLLNLCNPLTDDWGVPHTPAQDAHNAYTYGPTTADSWRTGTDVAYGQPSTGQWPNVLRNMDGNAWHPEAQSPGHYNDPDYLIPMRPLPDGTTELTQEESTTQFVMWAEMASPLVIGSDPRTLSREMTETLRNPEIIAVDQDPLAVQGVRVASDATGDVYSKVLKGSGRRAVVLLNRSDEAAERTVSFADTGLDGTVRVRDLRARKDRGAHRGSYTVRVPAHGTAFLSLAGRDTAPGTPLGVRSEADPSLVRDAGGRVSVFVRDERGGLRQFSGRDAAHLTGGARLGGPVGGRIVGRPAAAASPGGRIDVAVRGTDGYAYRRTFDGHRWGAWSKVAGGRITSAPAVTAPSGTLGPQLFARDAAGELVTRRPDGRWTSLGLPPGLGLYDDPAAVVDSLGRTHVVVRATDDSMWTRVRGTDGDWSAWSSLGGTVSGSPALSAGGDTVRLLARAGDYTVWQRSLVTDGTGQDTWSDWSRRPEFASAALSGAPGLAAEGDGVLAAFRGVTGEVRITRL
ncbi:glycoside hydrolase family 27 protein [Streptomyces sp. CA-253872]|uniref:glycoside hydrolase family 27 protein n=1 Tax=Streptomyces sp. CA-253872 TaxID=3240067 RepID=UPI003D8DC813